MFTLRETGFLKPVVEKYMSVCGWQDVIWLVMSFERAICSWLHVSNCKWLNPSQQKHIAVS